MTFENRLPIQHGNFIKSFVHGQLKKETLIQTNIAELSENT